MTGRWRDKNLRHAGGSRKTRLIYKLLLIPFGGLVGLPLALGLILGWDRWSPGPKPIEPADHAALREMLDQDQSHRGLYLFDQELGYRFKPQFRGTRHQTGSAPHVTNSLGLLGSEEISTNQDVCRIAVLGDSVTYGDAVAYESIFVSRMQRLAGDGYQLANAACPGWNTRQQFAFFHRFLEDQDWQAIVVVFCLNDLAEYEWANCGNGRYEITLRESLGGTLETLAVQAELAEIRNRFKTRAAKSLLHHDEAMLLAWRFERWNTYRRDVLQSFVKSPERPPVVFVAVPTRSQLEAIAAGAPRHVALTPQLELSKACQALDIPVIDLAEAFDSDDLARLDEVFLPHDVVHFSLQGHQLVAEHLWSELESELLPLVRNAQSASRGRRTPVPSSRRSAIGGRTHSRRTEGFSGAPPLSLWIHENERLQ